MSADYYPVSKQDAPDEDEEILDPGDEPEPPAPPDPALVRAQELAADPAWSFAISPVKLIGAATVRAAEHAIWDRDERAAYWTAVAAALVAMAGYKRGAVLADLVRRYGA